MSEVESLRDLIYLMGGLLVFCLASPVVETIRLESKPDRRGCILETCGAGLIRVTVGFHPTARNLHTELITHDGLYLVYVWDGEDYPRL